MSQPQQEFYIGEPSEGFTIPLVNVGNNRFMLKCKDDHLELLDYLKDSWVKNNANQKEKDYKKILEGRIGTLLPEIDDFPGSLNQDMSCIDSIKSNTKSRFSLIDTNEKKRSSVISSDKGSGQKEILSTKSDSDQSNTLHELELGFLKKYIFLGFVDVLKVWDIENESVKANYGRIFDKYSIKSLALTPDFKYQFIGQDCDGELKQWDIQQGKLHKDYGKVHSRGISLMIITNNGKYLFTCSTDRKLKQWNIYNQREMMDYGEIHNNQIRSIVATHCDTFQFTSSDDGDLKQWSIHEKSALFQSAIHSQRKNSGKKFL